MNNLKKAFALLFILSLSILYTQAQGNNIQEWTKLPDSQTHLEISWMVTNCGPLMPDQMHLFIFNESGNARTADFVLTLTDQSGAEYKHTVTGFPLTPGESITSDCSNTEYPELMLDIPNNLDSKSLTVTVQYNN